MYLRSSEKASGVENFYSAVGSKLIRRELVTKAQQPGLTPAYVQFAYAKSLAKPLAVGVLGAGRQGVRLLAAVNSAFLDVKSVADLRSANQDRAIEALLGLYKAKGWKIGADVRNNVHFYDSYEKLLAAAKDDGLEAVIIALPSHLHAKAALAALEAGLHVFVETPLALSVADAKAVARKAAEKNRILAVGQQRHYNRIYDHALEMVRRDLLDQVHYVRAQWHLAKPEKKPAKADAAKKEGKAAQAEAKKPDEPKIDWWKEIPANEAQAQFEGYASPEELFHWQLYEKFSGGLLAELGSQLFGAAAMFVAASPNHDPQRPYPLSVAGTGSQILRGAAGNIDDHVHCIFEYAIQGYVDDKSIAPKARKKIALQFDLIIGNEFDGYGETVLGQKGSLVLENEQKAMLFHTADVDKTLRVVEKKDRAGNLVVPLVPAIEVAKDGKADDESVALGRLALQGVDAGFATELEHWAFCCKPPADNKAATKPRCDAEAGLYTTVLTVVAAKAIEKGTRVDFKKEWFDAKSEETPDQL